MPEPVRPPAMRRGIMRDLRLHESEPAHERTRRSDSATQLIRNFDDLPKERELRAPLYDTMCARLAAGTAAQALGMSIDIVAPGMRGCPYHLHHAQEEAFVDPRRARHLARRRRDARAEGRRRRLPARRRRTTRTRSSTPRTRRSSTCRSAPRRGPRSSSTPTRASTWRRPGRADRPRFAPHVAPRREPRLLGGRALSEPRPARRRC